MMQMMFILVQMSQLHDLHILIHNTLIKYTLLFFYVSINNKMIKTYILIIGTMIISILIFNIVSNSCNKVNKSFRNNKNNLIQHFTNGSTRGRWIGGIKILPNNLGNPSDEDKVSKFKLKYSRDGTNWFDIDNGNEFTNSGVNNENIYFNTPVYAKKIRLLPTECVNKCTIKFDYLEHSGKDASGANLSIPIDCKVNEWSDTSCSKTCGGGTLTKTRTIVRQPQNNGLPCPSNLIREDVPCNQQTCAPIDCELSQWSEWSSCSKECDDGSGSGIKTKTRTITQQPKYNGTACENNRIEEKCNTQQCPVDCVVSDWGEWSECGFCGNENKSRTRTIDVASAHGGRPCGKLKEEVPCNKQECVTNAQARYIIHPGYGGSGGGVEMEKHHTCGFSKNGEVWGRMREENRNKLKVSQHLIDSDVGALNEDGRGRWGHFAVNMFDGGEWSGGGTLCGYNDCGNGCNWWADAEEAKKSTNQSDKKKYFTYKKMLKSSKKADFFTTQECPAGWSTKIANNITFKKDTSNDKYNLCRADLSKQGAIDFYKTIDDNHNVLKFRRYHITGDCGIEAEVWNSCPSEENDGRPKWNSCPQGSIQGLKLCKWVPPPEKPYIIVKGGSWESNGFTDANLWNTLSEIHNNQFEFHGLETACALKKAYGSGDLKKNDKWFAPTVSGGGNGIWDLRNNNLILGRHSTDPVYLIYSWGDYMTKKNIVPNRPGQADFEVKISKNINLQDNPPHDWNNSFTKAYGESDSNNRIWFVKNPKLTVEYPFLFIEGGSLNSNNFTDDNIFSSKFEARFAILSAMNDHHNKSQIKWPYKPPKFNANKNLYVPFKDGNKKKAWFVNSGNIPKLWNLYTFNQGVAVPIKDFWGNYDWTAVNGTWMVKNPNHNYTRAQRKNQYDWPSKQTYGEAHERKRYYTGQHKGFCGSQKCPEDTLVGQGSWMGVQHTILGNPKQVVDQKC
jgi:hypothetical protein